MATQAHTAIFGNGNVGTFLHGRFKNAGLPCDLYGRSLAGQQLNDLIQSMDRYDLILLCVSDDAIGEVSDAIPVYNGIIAHVSGATDLDVLDPRHKRRAVFYPLMSLRGNDNLGEIPFCLETTVDEDMELLKQVGEGIGSKHYAVNSEQRAQLHLAAVISHNFSNHLYHKAQELLQKAGMDFKMLLPLLENSLSKLHHSPARDLQTGPAIRMDENTIARHLNMIDDKELSTIYKDITNSIINTYDKKL